MVKLCVSWLLFIMVIPSIINTNRVSDSEDIIENDDTYSSKDDTKDNFLSNLEQQFGKKQEQLKKMYVQSFSY